MPQGDLFVWAHRGDSAHAPENTLAAFAAAEAAGCDGIELDVHLCRDGVPVVIHDETLQRTTDGRGRVAATWLRQLRELDAGSWYAAAFAGERLPTLREVLEWAEDRLRINIEIKSAAAGMAVLDLLGDFRRARVLISSFDHKLLAALRRDAPELPLGFLVDSRFWRAGLRRAVASGAESFHPRQDTLSRAMLSACRDAGLALYPWTVDDDKRLSELLRLGVDGVFTNDPARAIACARPRRRPGPGW
ncbi:glycerophosphoryl diester phosphodiesterase [Desulfuromonas versatilis]|uniref:Glycerophosphoryl diester phosphodiesterase n=1 Tax=Desulfuromonas versatilis TaxID=2802975 RepID=A0ABM8HQ49_9BACT|nr:glycerophosphodiester phosphodiesterase family protein [Desulfuromonas versatilis]BCR04196.1 glycerophosphoryl diester phosphodiesterase [Desulfuromonas versatilis]